MSERTWTKEPWVAVRDDIGVEVATVAHVGDYRVGVATPGYPGGNYRDTDYGTDAEDARRIVACVNALAGLPTAAIEAGVVGDMVAAFERIAIHDEGPAREEAEAVLDRLGLAR